MHIVHVIPGIWQHTGGPAEVVPRLCASLEQGCEITLMTLDGPHSEAALECAERGVDFRSYSVWGRGGIWYSPKLSRNLKQLAKAADIIHDHGLWLYPNWIATKWAHHYKKPLVITPHGLLGPNHLQRSRWKKLVAWYCFDRRSVVNASCVHLFTQNEIQHIRHFGVTCPLAVIPNGVDIWDLPDKGVFANRFAQSHGKKVLLFLARVHPIKGVFDLVDAWKIISKRYPEWHLVIAGSPEAECVNKVEVEIEKYGLQSSATLVGPQYGQHRLEAYAAADAFVLPSYAEGFSTSILEAMACRLPVVYTDPCNFPEAAERGASIVGPTGTEALARNIERLFQLSDVERIRMGAAGRKLIQEKYTWPQVAKRMKQTYEWILGGGQPPSWIDTV